MPLRTRMIAASKTGHPSARACSSVRVWIAAGWWVLIAACAIDDRQVVTTIASADGTDAGTSSPADVEMASGSLRAAAPDTGASVEPPSIDECVPGLAECTRSGERRECGADGTWASPVACPFVCTETACAGECGPDTTECVTATRFRQCSSDGFWSEAQECENACVGTACGGECQPGATRCTSATQAQTCTSEGVWGAISTCTNACNGAACSGECTPGATRCFSQTQQQSCNEQGQWQTPASCPLACVGTSCGGECSPNARRCTDTGLPQLCTGGTWRDEAPCAFICLGSGTCAGECSQGSRRCNPTTGLPQECNAQAAWQNLAPCDFICTGQGTCGGECAPGDRRCNPANGQPQLCSNAFRWLDQPSCNFDCNAGSCIGECNNGQRRCSANGVPQVCVGFFWQNQAACTGRQVCEGQGTCGCGQLTTCDGNCVDTETDPGNCGSCGHSCLGGSCLAGDCQPLELATGQDTTTDEPPFGRLVLDASNVYWVHAGDDSIRRVSKTGGNVQTVIPQSAGRVRSFAISANRIFWTANETLRGSTVTNGQGGVLATSANEAAFTNVGVSGAFVYWMDTFGGVFRRPVTAGPGQGGTEILFSTPSSRFPDWGRPVGTCMYFSAGSPAFGGTFLDRVCADGSGADTLFTTNRATIEGLDADNTGVYFITSFDSEVGGTTISRSPLTSDAAPTQLLLSQEFMVGIALDDAFVYFVEISNDATWRIPKNGGNKELFADPILRGAEPDSLISDGAALYWVDGDSIYKKAR